MLCQLGSGLELQQLCGLFRLRPLFSQIPYFLNCALKSAQFFVLWLQLQPFGYQLQATFIVLCLEGGSCRGGKFVDFLLSSPDCLCLFPQLGGFPVTHLDRQHFFRQAGNGGVISGLLGSIGLRQQFFDLMAFFELGFRLIVQWTGFLVIRFQLQYLFDCNNSSLEVLGFKGRRRHLQ